MKKALNRDWRDGFVITITDCSCRGPRLSSQYPLNGSQPSGTPVPGDLMPQGSMGTGHAHGTHTYKQIKHLNTENKSESSSGIKKGRKEGMEDGREEGR